MDPAGPCPPRARSHGHDGSTTVTPVTCPPITADQLNAGQRLDHCPISKLAIGVRLPVVRSAPPTVQPGDSRAIRPPAPGPGLHSHAYILMRN